MTKEEANKIIAEFMGIRWDSSIQDSPPIPLDCLVFDKSLDALVPVWEKLNIIETITNSLVKGGFEVSLNTVETIVDIFGRGETIQEAAAIATAKAIKELDDEKK